MARRFVMGGPGSPFALSASGEDAASADFADLLFDGNYVSLPAYAIGTFTGDKAVFFTFTPAATLNYPSGINAFTFGKTFAAPPLFTAVRAPEGANTSWYAFYNGSGFVGLKPAVNSGLTPFGCGFYNSGTGTGTVDFFGCFSTTTAFRSNRPCSYLIFDKPLG